MWSHGQPAPAVNEFPPPVVPQQRPYWQQPSQNAGPRVSREQPPAEGQHPTQPGWRQSSQTAQVAAPEGQVIKRKRYEFLRWLPTVLVIALFILSCIFTGAYAKHDGEDIDTELEHNHAGLIVGKTMSIIFCLLAYCGYTVEWIMSGTRRFLSNQKREETVYSYVNKLRATPPHVMFDVMCWHYETRLRNTSSTDAQGRVHYKSETYQEVVVTHRAQEGFAYTHWVDQTLPIKGLDHYVLTKVYLDKSYVFLDADIERRHEEQYTFFKARNKYDQHQTFSIKLVIDGFEARTLCYVSGSEPPWWVNVWVFALASIFLLSFPYRVAFDSRVGKVSHSVKKALG